MTRRTLLLASLATGCGRRLAHRYSGWLLIASAADQSLAVADLSEFRRVTSIPLGQTPNQVMRAGKKVFVSCPEGRTLVEIDPENLRIAGKVTFPGRIAGCAVCPAGTRIAVMTEQPATLHLVDVASRRITGRTSFGAGAPSCLDVSDEMAVFALGRSLTRVSLHSGKVAGSTELGLTAGVIRLHADAKNVLIGAADRGEIVTVNAETGQLLARLPMAFTPVRFCFNADMGQMFVTGGSGDLIAIVSPYQNEVDQTIVAGRTPYGMAVGQVGAQNLLFVTNPESGDVTVFDIDTRQHASSVHVGGKPGEVLVTPGGEYALTVDRESGDVAVIRLATVLERKTNTGPAPMVKPIFTIFPTGAQPRGAAIIPT